MGLAPTGKAPPCHGARRKRTFARDPAPKSPSRRDGAESPPNMPAEPLICAYSPLPGNRRLSQFVEQRLGLFEIGGIEPFGKPAVDRCPQIAGFTAPTLLRSQLGEIARSTQFE